MPRAAFDELMNAQIFAGDLPDAGGAHALALRHGGGRNASIHARSRGTAAIAACAWRREQATDARIAVPVSQEAMAMMLGITRQTLSKELKLLAAHGAITLG